ncbi:hypothetical protein PG996_004543 [Apiospora saccharicola]|uniref:Ankyrin repeat domain-containing protein n=1 Tax=Apiospora saccharicola TaxID=335842 RepID=A0ABR1W4E7_9PEZI
MPASTRHIMAHGLGDILVHGLKETGSSSAIRAAEAGRLDLVGTLFEVMEKKLSDFPHFDRELLLAGVRGGQKQVVQKLLDDGTDINGRVEEDEKLGIGSPLDVPLVAAASRGNIDMRRPIKFAAAHGHEEVVELLIERGASPLPAFFGAAEGGQPRVFKALLDRFPDMLRGGDRGCLQTVNRRWGWEPDAPDYPS